MKIGIFDSGLGGLIITHSLIQQLPEYNYLYLGDTARVPYGNRSQEVIYRFTEQAVAHLFAENCSLVIVACNTASAEALRRIQQQFVPEHFPDRKVLGVLIPAAEEAVSQSKSGKIGVLATQSTVHSGAYRREITKLLPTADIVQQAAPLLVPLIEYNATHWAGPILADYLQPFQGVVDTLILGCTHFPFLKHQIGALLGSAVTLISQDECIPAKLRAYLSHHPEIDATLGKRSEHLFQVTDLTETSHQLAQQLFEHDIPLQKVELT